MYLKCIWVQWEAMWLSSHSMPRKPKKTTQLDVQFWLHYTAPCYSNRSHAVQSFECKMQKFSATAAAAEKVYSNIPLTAERPGNEILLFQPLKFFDRWSLSKSRLAQGCQNKTKKENAKVVRKHINHASPTYLPTYLSTVTYLPTYLPT